MYSSFINPFPQHPPPISLCLSCPQIPISGVTRIQSYFSTLQSLAEPYLEPRDLCGAARSDRRKLASSGRQVGCTVFLLDIRGHGLPIRRSTICLMCVYLSGLCTWTFVFSLVFGFLSQKFQFRSSATVMVHLDQVPNTCSFVAEGWLQKGFCNTSESLAVKK